MSDQDVTANQGVDMPRQAAIIGGGVIGGGWAARFLLNGWDVVVADPDPEAARKVNAVLANARHALPGLTDVALPAEGRLRFVGSIAEAVKDASWVQESVPERLELKHNVLAQIQAHSRVGAIIASSTSGFKPSDLQQELRQGLMAKLTQDARLVGRIQELAQAVRGRRQTVFRSHQNNCGGKKGRRR